MSGDFSSRDLSSILSDTVDGSVSFDARKQEEGVPLTPTLIPRIDKSKKVQIYRKGKAPQFMLQQQRRDLFANSGRAAVHKKQQQPSLVVSAIARKLQQAQVGDTSDIVQAPHQGPSSSALIANVDSSIAVGSDGSSSSSEDEDDRERQRARALAARRRQRERERAAREGGAQEEHAQGEASRHPHDEARSGDATKAPSEDAQPERQGAPPSSSSSESGSSDEESSSDEELVPGIARLKPVYVPKAKRNTLQLEEDRLRQEEDKKKEQALKHEERKQETRKIVAKQVEQEVKRREELANTKAGFGVTSAGRPDDSDDADEQAAYEAWKLREMARLKRDREQRRKEELEIAETTRRRNMTDEERQKEDEELVRRGLKKGAGEKKKLKFLQKYYHKGVFYMDEDTIAKTEKREGKVDVRRKDYSEATLEDRFDKSAMPKAMQVKKFGKIGNTKWTHLANEDTSNLKDNLWGHNDKRQREKYRAKQAGVHEDHRKKRKTG